MDEETGPKIEANLILEVIGKPRDHLKDTLKDIIKKIGEEKDIKIIGEKVHEPTEAKENKDFFTTFADLEIQVPDVFTLMILVFKYMPSHVEVMSPEKMTMANTSWNDLLNELARRLHAYDEVVLILQNEKHVLETKLKEILEKK